mgnify:FL=1
MRRMRLIGPVLFVVLTFFAPQTASAQSFDWLFGTSRPVITTAIAPADVGVGVINPDPITYDYTTRTGFAIGAKLKSGDVCRVPYGSHLNAVLEDDQDFVVQRKQGSGQWEFGDCPTNALFFIKKQKFNVMTVQYWVSELEKIDKAIRMRTLLGMATADQRQERARILEKFKAARNTGS